MLDFHDFFNAIDPTTPIAPRPSHVSFDVHWDGGGARSTLHDEIFGFAGTFVESNATIDFTSADDDESVVYRSARAGQTSSGAGVGRERNGVFFS